MPHSIYRIFFTCLFFSLSVQYTNAKDPVEKEAHFKDIQHRQKQDFDKLNRLGQPKFSGGYKIKEQRKHFVVKESPCWKIDKITLRNSTVLSKQDKQSIIGYYVGQCLGLRSIKNLVQQFTLLYIKKGYITSRVVVKQQNLADKTLEIAAIEGKVGSIIKANPKDNSFSIKTAFPGRIGKILNLRDFEQGLEQLNRLVGVDVKIDYVASKKVGYTDVVIFNKQTKKLKTTINLDTLGSPTTGKEEGKVTFKTGNILNINDLWVIYLQHSLRDPDKIGKKKNIYISLNIPYGYWNLLLSMSKTQYDSIFKGQKSGISLVSKGDSTLIKSQITRTIYRNFSKKISVQGSIERSLSDNFIGGSKISASSYDITTLYFGLDSNFMYRTANITATVGISKILLDKNSKNSYPKDSFLKGEITFSKTLHTPSNDTVNLSSDWTGQYGFTSLLRNGLSLGGYGTVRGPKSSILFGDIGVYTRNTLNYTLNTRYYSKNFLRNFGVVQPYGFLDFGYAYTRKDQKEGYLAGGGIGIKLINSKYTIDTSFSQLLFRGGSTLGSNDTKQLVATFTINF